MKGGAMGTNWSPQGDSPGGNVLTREGYERMKQELDWLIRVKRREVAQRLREAREFGDIRENAEFAAAKEEQAQVEARIAELERVLRGARVVD